MLKEAVYHRPKNEYAYAINEREIQIRLKTKKSDMIKVTLLYGDPYDYDSKRKSWIFEREHMVFNGSDQLFDYWLVTITPKNRRLRYGFQLESETEILYFTEKGFFLKTPTDVGSYFCFPFLNAVDVFTPPNWVNNTVWYQIFPERFANGDDSIDPKGTLAWGSAPPTPSNFFGGDFQGIINHLDYLVELGITGLYFTPIFKAYSNHKYDTIDYMEIDPQFGDKATFKKLIEMCHERGIKVMLDAVFNHSGFYFPPFQDVIEKNEKSAYKDWFHIHNFPVSTIEPASYDTFSYVPSMPKLNTENRDVKTYLLNVAKYWIEEFDIDGWRLDVANEVDHHFWREFRSVVKKIKPDVYILGEIWHDSMPWLNGDQFDAVMNYPLTNAITAYFAKNEITTTEFIHSVTSIVNLYPETVNEVQFNLLGSHDTPRILTLSQNNKAKVKLQMLVQFTMAGTPCIYYGDEISMTGEQDPGCRECMIWDESKQDSNMFSFTTKLIALRKQHNLLRTNENFLFLETPDDENVIFYRKKDRNGEIIVLINHNNFEKEFLLPEEYRNRVALNLWKNQKETLSTTLNLNEFGFFLAQFSNETK